MYKKEGNRVENTVLGFIGAGNMATAIINGIVSTETMRPSQIAVFDVNEEKCAYFKQIGVQAASSASELASACSIIVLAVKPQNFEEVLTEIKEQVTEQKLMVSIAAGISTDYIRTTLGCQCPVIRTMPNTPLLLSQGATAMCRSQGVTDEMFETVEEFFSSCGTVSELEESQMNAVISVNGSSPAYFYLFAKAMLDNAEKQGIEKEVALPMIAQTLIGSAGMLVYSGKTPDELIEMVSSPGGTTLEALNVFYQHDLEKIVDEAMLACTKRAEELGK
ncbi:MAG: pyrroline-5-carboxylate reductase [Clostridiales bacterium]|nr:pyrroline-5-carboxylate reductase [Clostridiales bacterium]